MGSDQQIVGADHRTRPGEYVGQVLENYLTPDWLRKSWESRDALCEQETTSSRS
jgi:hypothetical protein